MDRKGPVLFITLGEKERSLLVDMVKGTFLFVSCDVHERSF
jgi:hypothetical protein